jgi:L-ascorbate metabolism protein UlaG (beta-lactamase superfamily)
MQLTKFNHACFMVTKQGQTVVVDPGKFSSDFVTPDTVTAVVVTHEHPDHLDPTRLRAITDRNPDAIIYAHQSLAGKLSGFPLRTVAAGDTVTVGAFTLAFFGGTHATIVSNVPAVANLGVLINSLLYYPGDSFVDPGVPVEVLALPACAPWLKVSEATTFLTAIHPQLAFPTHDAILSDSGKEIYDAWYQAAGDAANISYQRLSSPIEI